MRAIAWVVSATFIVVACGGKVTSVDSSKSTGSLTPTDQSQLCHDEYNYITSTFSTSDLAKLACANSFANAQGADCQTAFNDCVAKAQTLAVIPPPDCNAFAQSLANCNATVGQYSDCVQQEVNVIKTIESKLPFCTQGDETSAALQAESQVSATCLNLFKTCPISFQSSSSSSDGGTDASADGG